MLRLGSIGLFLSGRHGVFSIPNKACERDKYNLFIFIVFFSLFETLSELFKTANPLAMRFFLFYTGFAFIMFSVIKKNPQLLFEEATRLFGIYNVIQLITVLIYYPYGMNNYTGDFGIETVKRGAVYFLGGKNQMFSYMLLFLLCYYFKEMRKNKKLPKKIFLFFTVFICEAYFLDSAASILTLIFVGATLVIADSRFLKKIWRLFNPYGLLVALSAIFIVFCYLFPIYVSENIGPLAVFLGKYGRNVSFTGRTYIWLQAIDMIKQNPILGGNGEYYVSGAGVFVTQAHNGFYDIFSKYGIFAFVSFLLVLLNTARSLMKFKINRQMYIYCNSIFFVFLVHKCFEYLDIYLFFCMIFLIVAEVDILKRKNFR